MSRRGFLGAATIATAAAVGSWPAESLAASAPRGRPLAGVPTPLVDVNVTLSRWPARRLPLDETSALVAHLRQHGVTQAWAGSFDGLLSRDLAAVNARLADECRRHGRGVLVPFGILNPALPGWREDLRRCREEHQMPGIRLYPNYHGYKLDDPLFAELLDRAMASGFIVQLALGLEDERVQTPLLRVPPVDVSPLAPLLKNRSALPLVLLNWYRALNPVRAASLARAGQVYFDIATLEGIAGVANLLTRLPPNRLLFGSYAPFFYFEAAALKLKESDLSPDQLAAIGHASSQQLLASKR